MEALEFPDWVAWLERSGLPERQRRSIAITVRWYLGFCQRGRGRVDHDSARDFIAWAQQGRTVEPWQVEGWREALRWFFRTAKKAREAAEGDGAGAAGAGAAPPEPPSEACSGEGGWRAAFLTTLRRRHYSYRTEQSYQVWLERFARFLRRDDLAGCAEAEIKAFLDSLARDARLSASSQRQALNAVVFLLREVYGRIM